MNRLNKLMRSELERTTGVKRGDYVAVRVDRGILGKTESITMLVNGWSVTMWREKPIMYSVRMHADYWYGHKSDYTLCPYGTM